MASKWADSHDGMSGVVRRRHRNEDHITLALPETASFCNFSMRGSLLSSEALASASAASPHEREEVAWVHRRRQSRSGKGFAFRYQPAALRIHSKKSEIVDSSAYCHMTPAEQAAQRCSMELDSIPGSVPPSLTGHSGGGTSLWLSRRSTLSRFWSGLH